MVLKILDFLDGSAAGRYLLEHTWIVRTTDHGEHGMAHGGLRQKSFTVYEEALRVPLSGLDERGRPRARE